MTGGGGVKPKPGELTLAHRGVLYLDELPEFKRDVIEALRQPLEENKVYLSRLHSKVTMPSKVLLAATMNHVNVDICLVWIGHVHVVNEK